MSVIPDPTSRAIYTDEHHAFRHVVRRFLSDEVLPHYGSWREAGRPSREFWTRAGELGILGIGIPEHLGGLAGSDFRHSMVVTEEIQRLGMAIGGLRVQTDICIPYFLHHASDDQRSTWLPRLASGETVVALAMSEPGAGSDIKAMSTRAERIGNAMVVNGSKTFISNGSIADLVITAVKTDPEAGRDGISLLLVDSDSPGFSVGRKLDKLGLEAQDLAELSFVDMPVPANRLLGAEGKGFTCLTSNLAAERLSIAVNSQSAAVAALTWTVNHLAASIASQDQKFRAAACAVEVAAGQTLVDDAVRRLLDGQLSGAQAAVTKLYCTELQGRVTRDCLGLSPAGIAFRSGSLIGQAYLDGRVSRIYGGSSEIMKVIVGQGLGL